MVLPAGLAGRYLNAFDLLQLDPSVTGVVAEPVDLTGSWPSLVLQRGGS